MRNWILRGLVLAAAMVVVRLIQGALINAWQTQAALISVVLLLLFVIGVVVWGVFDGRADARANPDPDRRGDLAMTWLLAGLVAGVVSGAVAWLIAIPYKALYTGGLINEVTTFAAFTALLVFLPGVIGVAVGRWRVDRNPPPRAPGEERADTDVFSAVRGDEAPTGEIPAQTAPGGQAEARTGSVATAERDAPTEAIPTAQREAPTEKLPSGPWGARPTDDDAKTEAIRTDTDAKHTRPGAEPEQG